MCMILLNTLPFTKVKYVFVYSWLRQLAGMVDVRRNIRYVQMLSN